MNVLTASIQDCQGEHVVIFSFLLNSQPIYPGFCYCCLSNCMHTVKSVIKNDTVQIEGSRKYLIFLKRTERMNLWGGGRRKILGVKGGVTKNSFKFCNDGICNCANRLPQCQKPVSEWSLTSATTGIPWLSPATPPPLIFSPAHISLHKAIQNVDKAIIIQ